MKNRILPPRLIPCAVVLLFVLAGCSGPKPGGVVIFLDGAGWYSSSGSIDQGLHSAGYNGSFETFSWSAFLGPVTDHYINARSPVIAERLANKVAKQRKEFPNAAVDLIGLSSGTSVILRALEAMESGVSVDNVVLFSPSVSENHNLTKAMEHVRRNLYATCSPYDEILRMLPDNADGKGGRPAGLSGFRRPRREDAATAEAYGRVINIPWQPSYSGYGWSGSHTSVTSSGFVASVIAPRILTNDPYPLDRSEDDLYASRRAEMSR